MYLRSVNFKRWEPGLVTVLDASRGVVDDEVLQYESTQLGRRGGEISDYHRFS